MRGAWGVGTEQCRLPTVFQLPCGLRLLALIKQPTNKRVVRSLPHSAKERGKSTSVYADWVDKSIEEISRERSKLSQNFMGTTRSLGSGPEGQKSRHLNMELLPRALADSYADKHRNFISRYLESIRHSGIQYAHS